MSNIRVTELEFGQEMLTWDHKGHYPLEAITVIIFEDEQGEFYLPGIQDYVYHDQIKITGNENGYATREQVLRCVGRCWDKAKVELTRLMAESPAKQD